MSAFDDFALQDLNDFQLLLDQWNENRCDGRWALYPAYQRFSVHDALLLFIRHDGGVEFFFVELKGRKVAFDQYPDCAVEASKIRHLQDLSRKTRIPVLLVGIYRKSSTFAVWALDPSARYPTCQMYCNRHTAADDGKVLKEMVRFPTGSAQVYRCDVARLEKKD